MHPDLVYNCINAKVAEIPLFKDWFEAVVLLNAKCTRDNKKVARKAKGRYDSDVEFSTQKPKASHSSSCSASTAAAASSTSTSSSTKQYLPALTLSFIMEG